METRMKNRLALIFFGVIAGATLWDILSVVLWDYQRTRFEHQFATALVNPLKVEAWILIVAGASFVVLFAAKFATKVSACFRRNGGLGLCFTYGVLVQVQPLR